MRMWIHHAFSEWREFWIRLATVPSLPMRFTPHPKTFRPFLWEDMVILWFHCHVTQPLQEFLLQNLLQKINSILLFSAPKQAVEKLLISWELLHGMLRALLLRKWLKLF